MDVDQFLYAAFAPADPRPLIELDAPQHCSLSGRVIVEGHRFGDVVPKTTPVLHDTFRCRSDYVSREVGALFTMGKGTKGIFGSYLIIRDGDNYTIHRPVAGRDHEERPCWTDLVRSLAIGTETVALFTTDTQKRFWYRARVSRFGAHWNVFTYYGNTECNLCVDVTVLRNILPLLEEIYTAGFSKEALTTTLLDYRSRPLIHALGMQKILAWDRRLSTLRGTDAFLFATIIVQRLPEIEAEPTAVVPTTAPIHVSPQQDLFT